MFIHSNKKYIERSMYLIDPYRSGSLNIPMLDIAPGASSAYSLRKLSSSYNGFCLRVRKTDNSTKDIGFVGGILDTASLLDFCGSDNGFVDIWYDQSGNGNNASKTSSNPMIVAYGNVISHHINGKLAIAYQNESVSLDMPQLTNIRSVFFVVNPSGGTNTFLLGGNSTYDFHADGQIYFNSTYSSSNIRNGTFFRNSQLISPFSTKTGNTEILSLFTTGSVTAAKIADDRGIGIRSYTGPDCMQEIVIYSTDKSLQRTAIEKNINDFYKIY